MAKFSNGHIPWNSGLPKEKQPCFGKKNALGHRHSQEIKDKISESGIGRKHTEETKEKISKTHIGNKYRLGKKHTTKTKQKLSGENNYRWIEDRTKLKTYLDSDEKRSPKYKDWRRMVCNRDSWKCRLLNIDCLGRLEVHHIFNWTDYPELRYIITNGITLCHFHHPRKWEEEKRMIPIFQELLSVSKE